MAKKKAVLVRQANLLLTTTDGEHRAAPGLAVWRALEHVKLALKRRHIAMEEMLDWMSHPARRPVPVSLPSARAWFAHSKPEKLPNVGDFLLMCEFLDDHAPLNILIEHMGWVVVGPKDQELLRAARLQVSELRQKAAACEATRILMRMAAEKEGV